MTSVLRRAHTEISQEDRGCDEPAGLCDGRASGNHKFDTKTVTISTQGHHINKPR